MKNLGLIALVIVLIATGSCKRKDENTTCVAGTSGNVTMVAFPQHHGKAIPNKASYLDSVFIKFNTQDAPGQNASDYDAIFVGEAGEDYVHLKNLKCGKYYIYATGFDSAINQRVKGGIPYSFSQTSGEIDLNIPVTEGD